MSDRTPGPIEYMLRDVREALQMDVAFVSQFSEDQLVFRAIEGDAESFGWQEGESFPIDESYCKRVLDGRIPQVVPDAKGEDATKDLRVTSEADMGCYCAVPLVLSDGRLYGTLCCVSHTTNAGASTAILTAQGAICATQATPTGQGEQSGARAKG